MQLGEFPQMCSRRTVVNSKSSAGEARRHNVCCKIDAGLMGNNLEPDVVANNCLGNYLQQCLGRQLYPFTSFAVSCVALRLGVPRKIRAGVGHKKRPRGCPQGRVRLAPFPSQRFEFCHDHPRRLEGHLFEALPLLALGERRLVFVDSYVQARDVRRVDCDLALCRGECLGAEIIR